MIAYLILGLTFLLVVVHWLGIIKKWISVKRITAPLTIFGLSGWLVVVCTAQGLSLSKPTLVWFIGALLVSLVLSLLNCFSSTTIIFLTGVTLQILIQVGYTLGLNPYFPGLPPPKIILALLIMIPLLQTGKTLLVSLHHKKQDHFIPLVLLFLVTSFGLLFSSISTLIEGEWWADVDAYLVSSGGILLFISAIFFTFNFWVRRLSRFELKTALTFYSGTLLLTVGAVLHLINRV